jgi:hypothetical protein
MNAKGFVNLKDLGGDSFEDSFIANAHREREAHESTLKRLQENISAFDGDKSRALIETFPAKEMLEQAYDT